MHSMLAATERPETLASLDAWAARDLWRAWLLAGRALVRRTCAQPALWRRQVRQDRAWLSLSDAFLQDLGMTRWDVEHAAHPPRWPE